MYTYWAARCDTRVSLTAVLYLYKVKSIVGRACSRLIFSAPTGCQLHRFNGAPLLLRAATGARRSSRGCGGGAGSIWSASRDCSSPSPQYIYLLPSRTDIYSCRYIYLQLSVCKTTWTHIYVHNPSSSSSSEKSRACFIARIPTEPYSC